MPTKEAAYYLGVHPNTLRIWRMEGSGPKWRKIGRKAFYECPDLDAWIDSHPKLDKIER